MRLASSNPLTVAPNIDAFYYSTVYENGTGEFYGVHDLAPSHEFYIANYTGDFVVPIHTRSHQGFEHLFPGFPTAEFNVTLN